VTARQSGPGSSWRQSQGHPGHDTDRIDVQHQDKLLTVAEAAARLGTTIRFPRRLIAERRIRYVKLGGHVRIPASALDEFVAAATVEPIDVVWHAGKAS
jgi:excisionase family DNA binding protein